MADGKDDNAPGGFLKTTLSAAARSLTLRLLAESYLERLIGQIHTQGHQCDDGGNDEDADTNNQCIFHARRTRPAGKCVQGCLLCVRAAQQAWKAGAYRSALERSLKLSEISVYIY
jgi:hypothetical protein